MNQAYINAFLDIAPTIYGKTLLPFSLGHSLLLDFISSPFFSGGVINESDLYTAVWFSSLSFEDGKYFLENKENLLSEICKWKASLNVKGYDYQTELKQYQDYLAYYMTFPRRLSDEKKIDPKVPWQVSILWLLLKRMTETEALNMSLTKAFAYTACHSAENGDENLCGLGQSEWMDELEIKQRAEGII